MLKRTSFLFLSTGVALLGAKFAAVTADPSSASTGLFPQLFVIASALSLVWSGLRARRDTLRNPALLRALFILVPACWVMTGYILTIAWVDHNLLQRASLSVYDQPYKVWATRGLVTDGSDGSPARVRNSIESISYAFKQGARGTEVDVRYDTQMREFIVSHSRRYEKPNNAILTLETLLSSVGGRGYFWLDWKNLRQLDRGQLQDAIARLQQITDDDLKNRVYVEGEAPLSLLAVRRAGFQTIYDCRPTLESNILAPLVISIFKAVYYFGDFTALGMNSGTPQKPICGPAARTALRNIPLFLYHVPDDPKFLRELASSKDVRVMIIRQDINRFSLIAENENRAGGTAFNFDINVQPAFLPTPHS